jgi:hypothetical protein
MTIRYRGIKSFDSVLNKMLNNIAQKRGFVDYKLLKNWSFVVGKDIASFYYPYEIKEYKNRTILWVKSTNFNRNHEFIYHKANIVKKVNFFFGYNAIADVKIASSFR